MRVVLHTWLHAGEINAVSQMHGHPAISVVGPMVGKLEWRSERGPAQAGPVAGFV